MSEQMSEQQIGEKPFSHVGDFPNLGKPTPPPTVKASAEMRVITVLQPWATLLGRLKQFETRSWATRWRGPIAIHAGLKTCSLADFRAWGMYPQRLHNPTPVQKAIMGTLDPFLTGGFAYGQIVSVAELVDCVRIEQAGDAILSQGQLWWPTGPEGLLGDFTPGRYAWHLQQVRHLSEPIPFRGGQGLRLLEDPATLLEIAARLGQSS